MDQKMNLIVKVNINDTTSNVVSTSIDTVALLCKSQSPTPPESEDELPAIEESETESNLPTVAKLFYNTESVIDVFGENSEAHLMAKAYFGQSNNNGAVMIVPVNEDASTTQIIEDLDEALKTYDFYHVCVSKNFSTDAVGEALQNWATNRFKMVHLISDNLTEAEALVTALESSSPDRVSVFYSSDYLNVAIVSARCGLDPARGTWAHKSLQGIEFSPLIKDEMDTATSAGVNVYTRIAGSSRLFFGTVADKSFIDSVLKKDWLKFRLEERIFALLAEANSGYGLNLSDDGILAIGAVISNVFTEANRSDREYIMDNFSVSLPRYADLSADDKDRRNVNGIKAYCTLMDSVHTVLDVEVVISR